MPPTIKVTRSQARKASSEIPILVEKPSDCSELRNDFYPVVPVTTRLHLSNPAYISMKVNSALALLKSQELISLAGTMRALNETLLTLGVLLRWL